MSVLNELGIYEGAITKSIKAAYKALDIENFTEREIQDAEGMVDEELAECGNWGDITNSIISAYFRVFSDLINVKRKDDNYATYYVNCHDSHFYLNREEVYGD